MSDGISSYISTTTASVTRNSDDVTTTDLSWLGTENSVYLKFTTGAIGQDITVFSLHDGTANERIAVEVTGGDLHFIGVDGGVTQWDISTAIAANTTYQVAAAFAAGDIALYLDGSSVGTDAAATMPTVTTLSLGSDHATAEHIGGSIGVVKSYNTRLTNPQLEDMSNGVFP